MVAGISSRATRRAVGRPGYALNDSNRRWAQPLNSSDSTSAAATAKQKAPHQLNSLMASPHLCGKQEASHEENPSILRML